ncbi:MAG: ATPase, partial [Sedimentibacter sp.]|nr:ATPase [Sedimentibacter sp.]
MKEKHIFAGNNTSEGFFSYFDYLLKPEEAEHIYILKGGPGVGKNRFMKKFADEMEKKNYSIEYIHCSSDNASLDGILIPELKILIVDGTSPHT